MTIMEILLVLSLRHNLRQEILVPNVSWGLVSWGECDLLAVSKAGYITEYEIKTTMSDFKREWGKNRWIGRPGTPDDNYYFRAFRKMVKSYYIVVPEKLAEKVRPLIPEFAGAGLLSIDQDVNGFGAPYKKCTEVQPARINRKAEKLSDEQRIRMGHLAAMRYWSLVRKKNSDHS